MSDAIVSSPETRFSYCVVCQEPGRVGALRLKGWPHAPLVCAACLRGLALTIETDTPAPASARPAENGTT